jgi:hypothetical protein
MQGVSAGRKVPGNLTRDGKSLLRKKRSILPHYHHA